MTKIKMVYLINLKVNRIEIIEVQSMMISNYKNMNR